MRSVRMSDLEAERARSDSERMFWQERAGDKVGSLEVVRYGYETVDGEPKIVISMVKVLDTAGRYVKFARLKDVLPYLSKYPVRFKDTGESA